MPPVALGIEQNPSGVSERMSDSLMRGLRRINQTRTALRLIEMSHDADARVLELRGIDPSCNSRIAGKNNSTCTAVSCASRNLG
jgi:hypothetical protein